MDKKKKIFFASDFHLGLNAGTDPVEREKNVVRWLRMIAPEAEEIFLVGDVFDFWWEYKKVVPKGFTRFLGTLSDLSDRGIKIHFLTGNHDMWVRDYLSSECGLTVHTGSVTINLYGKVFHIAHGEGLGDNNIAYKVLLWIFRNRTLRAFYSFFHPRIGIGLAHRWSKHSRLAKSYSEEYGSPDDEALIKYARTKMKEEKPDFFIFGHRHIRLDYDLGGSRLFIMGNWFTEPCYVVWDGLEAELVDFT